MVTEPYNICRTTRLVRRIKNGFVDGVDGPYRFGIVVPLRR
jgi:hypothetical protein